MIRIWLACIGLLILQVVDAQNKAAVDWLNNNLLPIKSLKAGHDMEDLKKLDGFIGDSRVVALGECTHGSAEIFSMKHRIIEYLVKEKGFTIFSIEANMPEAYKLNDYILHGKGNAKALLAGMYFWTWQTEEVLELVEWMKKYNEGNSKKIYFTGFDMQFHPVALQNVKAFYAKHHIAGSEKLARFDSLTSGIRYASGQDNRKIAEPLMDIALAMQQDMDASAQAKQDADYTWIKQNVTVLWQYAASNAHRQGRDVSMAQNVEWIAAQNPGSKIILWAHNAHIHKKKYWMGKFLQEKMGKDYLAIGFTSEAGTYTAYNRIDKRNKLDSANLLTASSKTDYEYYLKAAATDNYFLLLNTFTPNDQNAFLFDKKKLRLIGALVVPGKNQFMKTDLINEFDALIFIRNTSSSRCFAIGN